MPKTVIKIKTWNCSQCGYRQDYLPIGNTCRGCGIGSLILEVDDNKMMVVTIAGEEEIDVIPLITPQEKAGLKKRISDDIIKFRDKEA